MTMPALVLGCFLIWGPWINANGFIFYKEPVGEITPMNPHATVNGTLELNCTVFEDSGLNASHLFWIVANSSRAPAETMTASGERTLLLRKNITSINEEGTYICRRNDETDYIKSIVSTSHFLIEYEPVRDVTNFNCSLDETKEEFYCSWELGLYNHIAHLNITIVMSPNNGMRVIHCPQKVKGQENCIWTAKDDAVINSMSKSVVLYINNMEFNVEKSFRKDFTHQRRYAERPTSCRAGWIHAGDSCYLIRSMTQSWAGARSVCDFLGAKLLVIESSAENELIKKELAALRINHSVTGNGSPLKYWTAGTDFQSPGTFLWGKDGNLSFTNWAGGQPLTHHCLALDPHNHYAWVAEDCEKNANFVCEKQLAVSQDSIVG